MPTDLPPDVSVSPPPRGPAAWEWAGLLGVFAFALLLRAPIADVPFERDEGEYAYIAQRWLLGEPPYQDNFDQKPPAVFAFYAVFLKLLGDSPAAIHWGTALYSLGTLAALFFLGRRLFGPCVGLLSALFGAYLFVEPSVLGQAANTEVFMALPLTAGFLAAVLAVERQSLRWAFAVGVFTAWAGLCKQVAYPNGAFYLLMLIVLGRPWWRLALAAVAGGLAVAGPVVGYFAAVGALDEFWDCVVGHNLAYASRTELQYYAGNCLAATWDIFQFTGPALVLTALGLVVRWPGPPAPLAAIGRWRGAVVVGWLLASFVGVSSGGYYREHYFIQMLPAVAVFAALGTAAVARLVPAGGWRVAAGLALFAAAVAFSVYRSPWYYLPGATPEEQVFRLYGANPFRESLPVARYLAERTGPDDRLFVLGSEPQVYFYAGRKSASRYIFAYPLFTEFADTRDRQLATIAELKRNRPKYLVTVHIPTSFLETAETPKELRRAVEAMIDGAYDLAGLTLYHGEDVEFVSDASPPERWAEVRVRYPGQTAATAAFSPEAPFTMAVWKRLGS